MFGHMRVMKDRLAPNFVTFPEYFFERLRNSIYLPKNSRASEK
jgi:hypothetical protein